MTLLLPFKRLRCVLLPAAHRMTYTGARAAREAGRASMQWAMAHLQRLRWIEATAMAHALNGAIMQAALLRAQRFASVKALP